MKRPKVRGDERNGERIRKKKISGIFYQSKGGLCIHIFQGNFEARVL